MSGGGRCDLPTTCRLSPMSDPPLSSDLPNRIGLCLRHRLLLVHFGRVGRLLRLDMSAPSLPLLSQTSSLLRADPSLRRASVLSHLKASCPLAVLPWHPRARFPRSAQSPRSQLTPPLCRPPSRQNTGSPSTLSQTRLRSLVSMASTTRFRHLIGGSLLFVFWGVT